MQNFISGDAFLKKIGSRRETKIRLSQQKQTGPYCHKASRHEEVYTLSLFATHGNSSTEDEAGRDIHTRQNTPMRITFCVNNVSGGEHVKTHGLFIVNPVEQKSIGVIRG